MSVEREIYSRGLSFLKVYLVRNRDADATKLKDGYSIRTELTACYAVSLELPAQLRELGLSSDYDARATAKRILLEHFDRRQQRSTYDRLLVANAFHHMGNDSPAQTILKEILDQAKQDPANNTAYVPVSSTRYFDDEIETNAWLLRTIIALDKQNPLIPQVVNWLAGNRKHGPYWRNTRVTALVITAISEYMSTTIESPGDQQIEYQLDAGSPSKVTMKRDDLFGFHLRLQLPDQQLLSPGRHQVTLKKTGDFPCNLLLQAESFRNVLPNNSDDHGISIERKYFLVTHTADIDCPDKNQHIRPRKGEATGNSEIRLVADDDSIETGDVIEVELRITADDNCEYVAFEDPKPAGFEPLMLQGGSTYDSGLYSNIELRDDRVVFFAAHLSKGAHTLRYKLRPETPGDFLAMPTRGFGMYAPEVHGQSKPMKLHVRGK